MANRHAWLTCFVPVLLAVGGGAACGPDRRGELTGGLTPARWILRNAEILTLEPGRPALPAIAIGDAEILAIGSEADIGRLRGPRTQVLDLGGRAVLPAFIDHHIHLLNTGLSLLNAREGERLFLDISRVSSLEELEARVRKAAQGRPSGTWILGKGWSQGSWGAQGLPTHHVLTRAAPEHPVYLTRADGHAGWANAAALRAAGITRDTADPPGGSILRLEDREPSGVLLERANEIVLARIPEVTPIDAARAFRLATAAMAAQGVVEAYDAGFLAMPGIVGLGIDLGAQLQALRASDAAAPLPVRVNLMIPAPSGLASEILQNPAPFREISPRLRVTHLKFFADGAMGSRGAYLSHPFADDPATHGVARMTAEDMRHMFTRTLASGLDVAAHAIGDAAVARVLNAYETLMRDDPDLNPGRLRIEHFSYARDEDFGRAAALRVILSVQPGFVAPDDSGRTMEEFRVGTEPSRRVYAWRRLQDLHARLAGGSDYFTAPGQPLIHYYAAATRKNTAGKPDGGWHPQDRLSREEALRLFTRLYPAGGQPPGTGTLRPGGSANLTVLSANPLAAAESEIPRIRVNATWSRGDLVFHDGSVPGIPMRPPAPER